MKMHIQKRVKSLVFLDEVEHDENIGRWDWREHGVKQGRGS